MWKAYAVSCHVQRPRPEPGALLLPTWGPVGLLRITRAELVHGKLLGAIAIMIARFPVLKVSQLPLGVGA